VSDKIFDQVMSDEPARAGHQCHFPVSHFASPFAARNLCVRRAGIAENLP
jgi:hypothetical protein